MTFQDECKNEAPTEAKVSVNVQCCKQNGKLSFELSQQ
jgi:hypothetical protein